MNIQPGTNEFPYLVKQIDTDKRCKAKADGDVCKRIMSC